jgi:hypothetical protein
MRKAVFAVATLVAAATLTACNSDDVQGTKWTMRPCDQARIDLATAHGQPTSIDADATDPRLQTQEVWTYVVKNTTANTKTTTEYTFHWGAGVQGCQQDTTVTTVPLT